MTFDEAQTLAKLIEAKSWRMLTGKSLMEWDLKPNVPPDGSIELWGVEDETQPALH